MSKLQHNHLRSVLWISRTSHRSARSRQAGFSLIEIMIVVVIMGILATLIMPSLIDRPDQARAVAARHDVSAIMQALKLYRLDHGRYPTAEQGLATLSPSVNGGATGQSRTYMDRLPQDPWGQSYQYLNPGVYGEVDVLSLGADGKPGGEGINADIGSW